MILCTPYATAEPRRLTLDTVTCCDALAFLRGLPDASVDAVITDPPYGCGTQVSARRSPDRRFKEIAGVEAIDATWIADAFRVLRPGGAIYVFAKWVNFSEWLDHLAIAGFNVRNCIVWDKMQHGTGDLYGSYAPRHEFILFAAKGSHQLRGSRPTDILFYPKVQALDLLHPYEKPIGLIRALIKSSTDEGGVVCDPFMGSGSTLVAAKGVRRHYIGCDLDRQWVDIACERLKDGPLFAPVLSPVQMELSL